ncbi:MAG: hypothetical protein M1827_000834 [Pycnora praestabilis]|nr:MAG: hypothetical protein M1827_000834 [Pycnora praestabilis]
MSLSASQVISAMNRKLTDLIDALEAHPEMQPPHAHKTIYYIWDFVQRSRHMLNQLDPAKIDTRDNAEVEDFQDILGRCAFAETLINDDSGRLTMMTGGDPSRPFDFGADVKTKARALNGRSNEATQT